jgi:hypothetical protein
MGGDTRNFAGSAHHDVYVNFLKVLHSAGLRYAFSIRQWLALFNAFLYPAPDETTTPNNSSINLKNK